MWLLVLGIGCSGCATELADPSVQAPSAVVDVLIVGSGPAGLSAAWAAREAGARVLILELADTVGPTAGYADNFLLADTQAQRDAGVVDSLERVAQEWPDFTEGGDAQDPMVQAFIAGLPGLEAWFLSLGAEITGPRGDKDAGMTPRLHGVRVGSGSPAESLALDLSESVWTQHRAVDVVLDEGAVVGVRFIDERSGSSGWVRAGATVVATGGFARNLDLVKSYRPELEDVALLYESHPLSSGAGLELLASADADAQNLGSIGVYVHAMADPRPGFDGEALLVPMLPMGMAVDASGERLTNEDSLWGLRMDSLLVAAEEKRIWVLLPEEDWAHMDVLVPGYNSDQPRERLDPAELEAMGAVQIYADIQAVADGLDLPEAVLVEEFERYTAATETGVDEEFGKDVFLLRPFSGSIVVVEVRAAAAKSFGGARIDLEGRVLDASPAPVPGLYAAGEVVGMLGTPDIGRGFAGSITAVHWTGLLAGESAASYGLERR